MTKGECSSVMNSEEILLISRNVAKIPSFARRWILKRWHVGLSYEREDTIWKDSERAEATIRIYVYKGLS